MVRFVNWLVISSLICTSIVAGEYSVIHRGPKNGARDFVCLEPMLDGRQLLGGFLYCDGANNQLHIDYLGLDPDFDLSIDLYGRPIRSLHYFSADRDTLYVYVAQALLLSDDRILEIPALTLFAITSDTSQSKTIVIDPFRVSGAGDITVSEAELSFADPGGSPGRGIAVSFRLQFDDHMFDRGRVVDQMSTSLIYSSDLEELLLRKRASGLAVGRFGSDTSITISYYDNQYHRYNFSTGPDDYNRGEIRGTTVGVDALDEWETIGHRTPGGITRAIFSGNFDPMHVGDELIIAGESEDLLDLHLTNRSHIAAYTFSGDSTIELWYHETPNFELYLAARGQQVLVGMNGPDQVVLINYRSGILTDSINLDFEADRLAFFETGLEQPELNMATMRGDTLVVLRLEKSFSRFSVGIDREVPTTFILHQNHPNPFNGETSLSFVSDITQSLSLKVFNILGQEIASLVDGVVFPGTHHVTWDGTDDFDRIQASGIYFARLSSSTSSEMIKLIYLK